jgi:hypothetical protein
MAGALTHFSCIVEYCSIPMNVVSAFESKSKRKPISATLVVENGLVPGKQERLDVSL